MTQEEKLLLLEDLSSRLMYGVIVDYKDDEYDHHKWKITTLFAPAYSQDGTLIDTDHEGWIGYDDYKGCGMSSGTRPLHLEKNLPFLRPMSSMTEEEYNELKEYSGLIYNHQLHLASFQNGAYKCLDFYLNEAPSCAVIRVFDWLNRKMFDYRGLIEKGLALETPEGMYEHESKSDVNESGSRIYVGCKIRSKTNPNEILSIISDDCHGDEFECANGDVLSLKQIEKYYDIIT